MRALYTAAAGMQAQSMNIDVISNNLANVNTVGFKKGRANFSDLLYQNIQRAGTTAPPGAGLTPVGLEVGVGSKVVSTQKLFSQGELKRTEQPYDIAIDGEGFLQTIIDPAGTIGYTRNGALALNADGRLVTQEGFFVEPAIQVPDDALPGSFSVGRDGIVTVMQPGNATATDLGQIQLAQFVNEAGLLAKGENVFLATPASGLPVVGDPGLDGLGTIIHGHLETSNVDIVTELVEMIQGQRAFEINSQSIQVADEMLQVAVNLRR